jgi:hypothetical protein
MRMTVRASLAIGATALLCAAPLIVRGNSCGHDFDFHLLSWMEVARAWHTGVFYPHWVQDANYGAGEPRLIFYPPASWMVGAMLGSLAGWHAGPVLFVLAAFVLAGAGMYRLARLWTSGEAATIAASFYIANPYTLFVVFERSALAELLAAAWFPWIVRSALAPGSSIAALALSIAALWLTNSPAAVVGSYLLAFLAAGMAVFERKWWPVMRAAAGMALGLGLAAVYIVPAVVQQKWVQIERAINPGMRVQDSFLFAHTANAFHDHVLHSASWIFVGELIFALAAALLAARKRADGSARLVLTYCLPLIFFLQLPVSNPVWQYAPHWKFLQFPWRWLLALNLAMCALAAMAWGPGKRAVLHRWSAVTLIVLMSVGAGFLFYQPCDEEDAVTPQIMSFRQGGGVEGTDEYTPAGADSSLVQQHLPLVQLLAEPRANEARPANGLNPEWTPGGTNALQGEIKTTRRNAEHWEMTVSTTTPGFAILRLMDYPAWKVTVDGSPTGKRPRREDGLMAIPLSPGMHMLEIQWSTTRDLTLGRSISLVALVLLLAVAIRERRPRPV